MALDKMGVALKKADSEHHTLANQIRELERDVIVLRRANEEAMRMRSVAMEERSKVSMYPYKCVHIAFVERSTGSAQVSCHSLSLSLLPTHARTHTHTHTHTHSHTDH